MRRTLAERVVAAVLIVGAALTAAACTTESDEKGPRVAGDEGGQDAKDGPRDDGAVAQAYAQCLRDQGHEVKVDERGRVAFPAAGPGDAQGGGAGDDLRNAMKVCDAKVPGMKQLKEKDDTESLKQARGLVECLRANGVPGMPDPEPEDRGAVSIPEDVAGRDTWTKAMGICGDKFPGVAFKAVPAQ